MSTGTRPLPPLAFNAGIFLAKARELSRRLRCWHLDDFPSPVSFVSLKESRGEVCRLFREIISKVNAHPSARPERGLEFFMREGGKLDEKGYIGEAYPIPDRDTDRSLTMWLMGDFLRHLDAAPPLPALDYLKESFGHILELPAWTVRGPHPKEPWPEEYGPDQHGWLRGYMVTGRMVPTEFLETLIDAGEKLLATAPPDWGSAAPEAPSGKANSQGKPGRKRRRRASPRKLTPLTPEQLEAVQLVSEHKGNIAAAARAAGKSRAAMQKLCNKANRKLGKKAIKHYTQRLPTDSRGQEMVAAEEEE